LSDGDGDQQVGEDGLRGEEREGGAVIPTLKTSPEENPIILTAKVEKEQTGERMGEVPNGQSEGNDVHHGR